MITSHTPRRRTRLTRARAVLNTHSLIFILGVTISFIAISCALFRVNATRLTDTPSQGLPQGITTADWTGIRQEYERHRHAIFQRDDKSGKSWQARNSAQQLLAQFDGRGFTVSPEGTDWHWGLELQSYGFPGSEQVIRKNAGISTALERLNYNWDATLQEWYINDGRGLEHGFTLKERPGTGDKLTLRMKVRGGLRPQVQTNGRGVSFLKTDGTAALTYTGLTAIDAAGQTLPARIEAEADELRLIIEEKKAQYPITIDPIIQQAYLKASNTEAGDAFGISVAIAGDTVVVGARNEASNATGVNGNQGNNSAPKAGAAYVFVRGAGGWSQQAYLKASNTEAGDEFGYAVAISGDTIIVGAPLEDGNATGANGNQSDNSTPDSGAAYVFVRNGSTWSQQAYIKSSNPDIADLFGWSVGISGDTAVAGAWLEASKATGINGDQSDNSAVVSGAAYVFGRNAGNWNQQAYLKASNTDAADSFGFSVAIAGETILVGAPFEAGNATGVNGNQNDNTAGASGAVYAFARQAGIWTQQAYLKASNTGAGDLFGWSVAISEDTMIVGAPLESSDATGINGNQNDNSASVAGAAYVFARSAGLWNQQAYVKASNTDIADLFGWSVGISGDRAVVGAQGESSDATGVNGNQYNNTAVFSGAAYAFVRLAGMWSQQAYLKASNPDGADTFGITVAISGDTILVGAPSEASDSTGVNGSQSNNAPGAGAAYIFVIPPPDLALTKTDGGAIFMPGGMGNYTITVSNTAAAGPTIGPITVTDNLPANLTLQNYSGVGWSCTGTTNLSCTYNGIIDGGASLPALTLIVKVGAGTPTGLSSIKNTAMVSTPTEVNFGNNADSVSTSVLGVPKLMANLADPLVCNGPGGLASVTATLTNPNQTALPANFTAMLPANLTALAGTCNASTNPGGCTIAQNGSSVTWSGTLNPGQTVTISYQAQIAANVAQGTQLCVNSVGTVAGVGANVQACLTVNCTGSGLLPVANVSVSDQKPGSLLVFPYYSSSSAERRDTRLTLSNVGAQMTFVHVFLIEGVSCNQADFYVCLTPKAIYSFRASDYDPENTGFVLAVAVDDQGRPIAQNGLIGNAFVDDGEYQGNYGAEAFWRYDTARTNVSNSFAVLGLNGTQYDAAPIQLMVEIQSPLDAIRQKLIVAPLSGDLSGGMATLGNAFPVITNAAAQIGPGLASNEEEKTASFVSLLGGGCLKSATLSTNSPRVPGGLGGLIPKGKMGLLNFRVGAGVGLLMTPRTETNRWAGIRSLHKTAMGNVAIAIPVFAPVC
jgi:uncharacterized repeat protein (TIGR01451 family)